jgi:hypothetical protein
MYSEMRNGFIVLLQGLTVVRINHRRNIKTLGWIERNLRVSGK